MSTIPNTHDDAPSREPYAQMPHNILVHRDLRASTKVLYGLLDRHWRDKTECYPFQETLASMMGVSVETVRRGLRELEKANLVRTVRRGLGRSNIYVRLEPRQLHVVPDPEPDPEPDREPDRAWMTGLDRALMPAPIGRRHKGRKHNAVLPPDEPKTARRGGAASSWDDETRISFASLVTELQDADAQTASVLAQSFPTLTAHDFDYALERLWKARKDGVGPTGSKEPLESEAGFVVAVLRDIAYCYELAQRLEKGDSLRFPLVTESCRDR